MKQIKESAESDSNSNSTDASNKRKRNRKSIASINELTKHMTKDVYSFKSSSSDEGPNKLIVKSEKLESDPKSKRKSVSESKTPKVLAGSENENDTDKEIEDILENLEYVKLHSITSVSKVNVCFVCEFSDDLIQCHGTCQRFAHLHCVGFFKEPDSGYKCDECLKNQHECFICKTDQVTTKKCSFNKCGRYYHEDCIKTNDLFQKDNSSAANTIKHICPLHTCVTCWSETTKFTPEYDQSEVAACLKVTKGRFYQCVRCPTAYHIGDYCLAAGSIILDGQFIVCPKHFQPMKLSHHLRINVTWCFVCCKNGDLIGCSSCPSSYHIKCINKPPASLLALLPEEKVKEISSSPENVSNSPSSSSSVTSSVGSSTSQFIINNIDWLCEDCAVGKRPVTGEIVWAKAGLYRWWPAQICHPRNLPDNLQNKTYQVGEYPVKFFGTNDYYWINIGRCFSFHENDDSQKTGSVKGKSLVVAYQQGVNHAIEAFKEIKKIKLERLTSILERGDIPLKKISLNFQFIKTNRAVGDVIVYKNAESESHLCNCDSKKPNPCGTEDCMNRILKYECRPDTCPAGERCQNQRFVKRLYPKQVPFNTISRGTGLKTLVDIKKGDFVNEYVGELITEEECKRRLEVAYEMDICNFYFLTIDKDRIIDAGYKGNNCRFMNHCCDPNCQTQKWIVNGDIRVGLFALTDIPAETELTFNYNLDSLSNAKAPCKCGAKNCSGFIGERPKNSNNADETKVLKAITSNGANNEAANRQGRKPLKRKMSETSNETVNVKARSKSATPKETLKLKELKMEKFETSSTTSSSSSTMSNRRKSRV